ncbi:SDR family oxidoreductase [Kitasatospora sp. NPDC054939]
MQRRPGGGRPSGAPGGAARPTRPAATARRRRRNSGNLAGWLTVAPALLVILGFTFYPVVQSMLLSTDHWNLLGPRTFVGVENYQIILAAGTFRESLLNTLVLHRTAAPGLPAYAAAKGAIAALTRQLAVDYGRYGVSFATLSPGWVRTPATESRLAPGEEDLVRLRESNPMRTTIGAEEIAAAVAFASSPAAGMITGSELVLDAGASVVSPASLLRDSHRGRMGLPPLDAR